MIIIKKPLKTLKQLNILSLKQWNSFVILENYIDFIPKTKMYLALMENSSLLAMPIDIRVFH